MTRVSALSVLPALLSLAVPAWSEPAGIPALTVTSDPAGEQSYTITLQILLLMTMLTLLPSIVIMMTAFTRIIVVFAILRQALGLQQTPSNQVLIGLALFLTLFVMMPVIEEVRSEAVDPYLAESITPQEAFLRGQDPVRGFMLAQTRVNDLELFMRLSETRVDTTTDIPTLVLIPAFVTSELKTAFQIGFVLFIPFLIIDMVVASVLMSMGMMMLSPLIVSLPFKLMLFVLVDGWAMLVGSLAASFV